MARSWLILAAVVMAAAFVGSASASQRELHGLSIPKPISTTAVKLLNGTEAWQTVQQLQQLNALAKNVDGAKIVSLFKNNMPSANDTATIAQQVAKTVVQQWLSDVKSNAASVKSMFTMLKAGNGQQVSSGLQSLIEIVDGLTQALNAQKSTSG